MLWRNIFVVVWLTVEISLAFYVGIGYTILLGYLLIAIVLVILLKPKWATSDLVKAFLGGLYTPDTDMILRGLSKSRSYKVTVVVTSGVLIAISILAIIALNFRLIEFI